MMEVCVRVKLSGTAGRTGNPVGKDLAEMDEVSYFTLRRRRGGWKKKWVRTQIFVSLMWHSGAFCGNFAPISSVTLERHFRVDLNL